MCIIYYMFVLVYNNKPIGSYDSMKNNHYLIVVYIIYIIYRYYIYMMYASYACVVQIKNHVVISVVKFGLV